MLRPAAVLALLLCIVPASAQQGAPATAAQPATQQLATTPGQSTPPKAADDDPIAAIRKQIDDARFKLQSARTDAEKSTQTDTILNLYFDLVGALKNEQKSLNDSKSNSSGVVLTAINARIKDDDAQIKSVMSEVKSQQYTKAPAAANASGAANPTGGGAATDFTSKVNAGLTASESTINRVSLVLGLGSLVTAGESDYQNQSNVLQAKSLGKATPQLLTGLAFRTWVPNFHWFCKKERNKYRGITDETPADDQTKYTQAFNTCYSGLEPWQKNPFNAFVSLKFAPNASDPINGYVIGGSYSIHSHFDILVGYALSPISEPSPGFINAAVLAVQNGQPKGNYKEFDPVAMAKNAKNAFDGFPLTDPTTKALIYQGNALATHYRGGAIFGVSFPFSFGDFLKPAAPAAAAQKAATPTP